MNKLCLLQVFIRSFSNIKFCFKNFIHGVTKLLFEYNGRAKLNSTFGLFFNLKGFEIIFVLRFCMYGSKY